MAEEGVSSAVKSKLNLNLGVLGHVDSGKTSLAKVLSTVASTAAFDKNPQSKERGITLDLGFSSFTIPAPAALGVELLQFTIVDCPGHASLIRTIIGGAQIIDQMILVVDVTKGVQTQTAECLVIGEITCSKMIVVINKIDLLPEATRSSQVEKMKKRLAKTLEQTKFRGAPIVAVAAKPGGVESSTAAMGLERLLEVLSENCEVPERKSDGPLVYSVDHCFSIRGQGTIMTGTVLSGTVSVNQTVEIPLLKLTRKIKSLQMFREPVQSASQGDRVGVCVTQFDPSQVERCLIATPGYLRMFCAAIINVQKVPYHKLDCKTGSRFHISIGHETVMAKATFFASPESSFNYDREYPYQEFLLPPTATSEPPLHQFALLELEKEVVCPPGAQVVGSRLDCDAYSNMCRIAFHGSIAECITDKEYAMRVLPNLKIFKSKCREGIVDRVQDERTVIGKALFKKETKMDLFTSMKVRLSTGEVGVIEGTFGTTGKFRVACRGGLSDSTVAMLRTKKKAKGTSEAEGSESTPTFQTVKIILEFKRYIFDPAKRMIQ